MILERFYPIVDRAEWLERLLPCGIRLVQLRVKDIKREELKDEVRHAMDLCRAHGCQLVVNDHWELALELGCDFVHLGQEDLVSADLSRLAAAGVRIGVSTHDERELDRALAVDPFYVALGPVYPTKLKQMKWAPQGLDRVAQWKGYVGAKPLVAIGGMTAERATAAFAAGADSIAVVTDIAQHQDPAARTREWLNVCRPGGS